ncbi:MAG: GTP-binding protein, partial [Proteobacteria bacterium]|nr:GTP-binding protein [Pseudomonadota bacterium]
MKDVDVAHTRNFALIGHAGDGKTSVGESILHRVGAGGALGRVDDGSSHLNTLPEEKDGHTATVTSHLYSFDWSDHHLTLVDTPGDPNFHGDGQVCLQALDGAILVVSAVDGVKVGTEKMHRAAGKSGVAILIYVNGLDRERADFEAAVASLSTLEGPKPVVLAIPVGEHASFSGVIDLVRQKQIAADGSESDIPAELADEVASRRLELIEAVAECDDALLEKYLDDGELSEEEVITGLVKGTRSRQLAPILCGSATSEIGTEPLLRAVRDLLPSPADRGTWAQAGDGEAVAPDPAGPFSGVIFKTQIDRYAGT